MISLNALHFLSIMGQFILPDNTWIERLRQTGTLDIAPVGKFFDEAVMPLEGTAIDVFPFVLMFSLLAIGTFFSLKLKNRQKARRAVQVCSTIAFIAGVHPCFFLIRDLVLGASQLSSNSLEAFKYLMNFSVVVAFGLVFGRIFCGWVCPLGFFQEIYSGTLKWVRVNKTRRALTLVLGGIGLFALGEGTSGFTTIIFLAMPFLILPLIYTVVPRSEKINRWTSLGLVIIFILCITFCILILKPDTFVFIENVAVWWVLALMALVLLVVSNPRLDSKLKPIKFFSAGLMALILVSGVFTDGPFCIFFQGVVSLSTILSALGIIVLSGILSNAWCRYLCPEGAILGILARYSRWKITKVDSRCNSCRACEEVCPVEAISVGERDETTCIFCSKCVEVCPTTSLIIEDVKLPSRLGRPPGFVLSESIRRR